MRTADTERTQQAEPENSEPCPEAGCLGHEISNSNQNTFPFNSEFTKQQGVYTTTWGKKIKLDQG